MDPMEIYVPYHEKDTAKALGARWNAARKTWYIPPGVDINKFGRWSPEIRKWDGLADGHRPSVPCADESRRCEK
jgi:hypothetical protein